VSIYYCKSKFLGIPKSSNILLDVEILSNIDLVGEELSVLEINNFLKIRNLPALFNSNDKLLIKTNGFTVIWIDKTTYHLIFDLEKTPPDFTRDFKLKQFLNI
jgi:hypothetical protein